MELIVFSAFQEVTLVQFNVYKNQIELLRLKNMILYNFIEFIHNIKGCGILSISWRFAGMPGKNRVGPGHFEARACSGKTQILAQEVIVFEKGRKNEKYNIK